MALIMTDIRGALLSGLYATRSITKPRAMMNTIIRGMLMYSGMLADIYTKTRPATMNTSP